VSGTGTWSTDRRERRRQAPTPARLPASFTAACSPTWDGSWTSAAGQATGCRRTPSSAAGRARWSGTWHGLRNEGA